MEDSKPIEALLQRLQQPDRRGSNALRTLSAKQLSAVESETLTILLHQFTAHWPNQEIDPMTADSWRETYEQLTMQHGIRRVRETLRRFLAKPGQKFFPHPTEVAEELEAMAADERSRVLKDNPFTPCGDCDERGYRRLDKISGKPWDGRTSPTATKLIECQCHCQWNAKVKGLLADPERDSRSRENKPCGVVN